MAQNEKPYLSIIITSRNDDYQGNAFGRMQTAISSFIEQAKHYNLKAELIIVDWNPPKDKLLLKDAISLPKELGPVRVRFVAVPATIHQKYNSSERIKIIAAAALNVGIRRARGEFIVPTTSDILFSSELIQFLAQERLGKEFFYRADRCDVSKEASSCASLDERMDFCAKNIIRVNQKSDESPHGLARFPTLHVNAGDFILFSKEFWHLLHGWPETNNLGLYSDGVLCYMAYLAGLKEKILEAPLVLYHIDHNSRWKTPANEKKGVYNYLKALVYDRLPSHSRGRTFLNQTYNFANEIMEPFVKLLVKPEDLEFDLRYLSWQYKKTVTEMLKRKRPYIYNNDNWGFPEENFSEFILS